MIFLAAMYVKYIIITAVIVVVFLLTMTFFISFKLFLRIFHVDGRSETVRSNSEKNNKISQNPDAQKALSIFENAKAYFFNRPVSGTAQFLEKEDWKNPPLFLEECFENDKPSYAYMFESLEKTDKYIILVHGYNQSGLDTYKTAYSFIFNGYNVLAPDLKGHGRDESKYVTMGRIDAELIKNWADIILKNNKNAQIVLCGISMGASTALIMTEFFQDNKSVKAVIADSAFCSAYEEIVYQVKRHTKLPVFPFLPIALIFARLIAKTNIKKSVPMQSCKNNTNIPVLFFHGLKDKFVLPSRAERLYKETQAKKSLTLYENAAHAQSMVLNYDDYFNAIFAFLDEYV